MAFNLFKSFANRYYKNTFFRSDFPPNPKNQKNFSEELILYFKISFNQGNELEDLPMSGSLAITRNDKCITKVCDFDVHSFILSHLWVLTG